MAPPPSSYSSSSSNGASFHPKRYDVFISFRGEDTRNNFTSHLRHAMRQKQIEVYIDDEINKGDGISPALFGAIEDSLISVIVFSEDYASSKWCLDELLKILDCRKTGQDVIPVFYEIDPSNVRNQKGSYEEAFKKHERDFSNNQDKLTKWKHALFEAANLAGWDSRIHRDESTLIQKIVEDVLKKLENKYPPPRESKCPFGTEENLAPIESLLIEFQTIGIWGTGGIGKTTIAKWLFGKYSSQYEGSCFLENIRENFEKDKQALRKYLVSRLLGEYEREINVESVVVKRRLFRKRVFVVLDDVSTSDQLEYLDGELQCFGSGSKIIITSRDMHVLLWKGVDEIHHVKELNLEESLQLFSLNAFKQNDPLKEYEELSNRAVAYAKGLPLVLKVVGSFLHSRSKNEWESALKKLRRIPDGKIQSVLKLSYDAEKELRSLLEAEEAVKGSNSGTLNSFNNKGNGNQDFSNAMINSGAYSGVLDDVSTSEQLEYLDGELECFGSGSTTIITSRDKHNLSQRVDEIKIHQLNDEDKWSNDGTLNSFNNNGNGEQYFSNAKINSGAYSGDRNRYRTTNNLGRRTINNSGDFVDGDFNASTTNHYY